MAPDKIKESIPYNDGNKELSEAERKAWVQYATKNLQDNVLDGLTVNVNGTEKYIKDVVQYNSDISAIQTNPEEVIKLQLFLKKRAGYKWPIDGKYNPEIQTAINTARQQKNPQWEMTQFQQKYPAFNYLVQKYPNRFEEFKKRALLFQELWKAQKAIEDDWVVGPKFKTPEIWNIKIMQQALVQNPDNSDFKNNTVKTSFEWWNHASSINCYYQPI